MKLKILSWNVRQATQDSPVWSIISEINPDIALLQEVNSVPNFIKKVYDFSFKHATTESGTNQRFKTGILVKGKILNEKPLKSELEWVNHELEFFKGNLLSYEIKVDDLPNFNVISVYSPAWPVDTERLKGIDVSSTKLIHSKDVWCTEILWSALKKIENLSKEDWIIAGDFNSSVTFDYMWSGGPHGNKEIIERMGSLGLKDCLFHHNEKIIPTFKNSKGGKVIHQIDHMYVSRSLLSSLSSSYVGDCFGVFENSLSDHLPIISEFEII